MKKLILATALIFSFIAVNAQIEVKINPIGAIFLSPDLAAEFGVSEHIGIEPTIGRNGFNFTLNDTEEFKSSGLTYATVGKYYFNPKAGIDRFYCGLYLRGVNRNLTNKNDATDKLTQNTFGFGFSLGYKWVTQKNVVIELGTGIGRKVVNNVKNTNGTSENLSDVPFLNLDGYFRFNIGHRFGGGSKSK